MANLRRIGYAVSFHTLPDAKFADEIGQPKIVRRVQVARDLWAADYLSATGYVTSFFHCDTPDSPAAYVCAPWLDKMLDHAAAQEVAETGNSNALWTKIDRLIVDRALIVPLSNPVDLSFGSARLGNLQYHPEYGVLYDQAWVR